MSIEVPIGSAYVPIVQVRSGLISEYSFNPQADIVLQFLTNPWDDENLPAPGHSIVDWIDYREIRAFSGLKSGHQMPPGLKTFPACDTNINVVGKQQQRTWATDPLLEYIQPAKWEKEGTHRPSRVIAVNAVFVGGRFGGDRQPTVGEQIVLKFSITTGGQLKDNLDDRHLENPSFDCTQHVWRVYVKNEDTRTLSVTMADQDMFIPSDDYAPTNLSRMMNDRRRRAEQAIQEMADEAGGVEAVEQFDSASEDDEETFEAAFAAVKSAGIVANEVDPADAEDAFKGVSEARLRRLLAEAGVSVPRGASRDVLVARAVDNGWSSAADLPSTK